MPVNMLAFDIFKDEIRLPGRRYPGIEEFRDVRVREPPEHAALALKSFFAAMPY
jgi:hypothetical protein